MFRDQSIVTISRMQTKKRSLREQILVTPESAQIVRQVIAALKGRSHEPRFRTMADFVSHAILEQARRDWPAVQANLVNPMKLMIPGKASPESSD